MAKQMVTRESNSVREPLFHIAKRNSMKKWQIVLIYAAAIAVAYIVSAVICTVTSKSSRASVFSFLPALFRGAVGSSRKVWSLIKETSLLLAVSLAIVLPFKMKFWNLGGNGQVLIGCLAANACMYYLRNSLPVIGLFFIAMAASILAGIVWAVIPAIFKAMFNTNESLFTLMMNYIANSLVLAFIAMWNKQSTSFDPSNYSKLAGFLDKPYIPLIVAVILTAIVTVYLRFSKHGYEISVVGESRNTAKYIGINVKKVTVRTLVFSGAICGLVGMLLANSTFGTDAAKNMGFTAIMTTWLGNFNPLFMALSCFLVSFTSLGVKFGVKTQYGFTNNAIANVVLGITYLIVISCTFFTQYVIVKNKKHKEDRQI